MKLASCLGGLLFSVAGPDTRKSPPKKMGSAVTRKRFKSSPVPSTGAEGAAGGSEQGLRAWSLPAGGYGALLTLESGSLSCGAREVRSPCAWRGGARPGSRVTGGD